LGNEFFGKESVKPSEEKPVEKLSEQPQPKPKPKPIRFHCDYCGRDGHKEEFSFKRKREERMAKEWANKDRYNPPHGVRESRMSLPRGKAIVHTVSAWGEKSALGGRDLAKEIKWAGPVWKLARPVWKPVRPVWVARVAKLVRPVPKPVRPV
jgi:hypothetical protein